MPLSLGAIIGFFPIFLVIFPIGTFITGLLLMKSGGRRGSSSSAI